jgi:hypothetical protein
VGQAVNDPVGEQPVYLIGVPTFESRPIAGSQGFTPISWSGDGRYLLLLEPGRGYRLASVDRATLEPGVVCPPGDRTPLWQPDGARLACPDSNGRRVSIWDAATGRVEGGVELPAAVGALAWSERGGRLALLAEDGTLWWLANLAAGRVEQLTPPMSSAGSVRWSPGGRRVGVATATEVYAVDLGE